MKPYGNTARQISTVAVTFLLALSSLPEPAQAQARKSRTNLPSTPSSNARSKSYQLTGGWWFDGRAFARKTFYVVDGVFRKRRPANVDTVLDLGNSYVVPPFGDAHSHAFDNPANIAETVAANLREGIFYALSLTNSIAGKRDVAASVNHPTGMDVGYADAGLTSTRGHPIMSAEMAANHWSWDSLGEKWPLLLKSRKAEGDVYFILDSLADLRRQWSRIVASRPDLIKIFLLSTERFAILRADTTSLGHVGLDPALVAPIVDLAHRDNLRVAAHVDTAADFRLAVGAGVDIIAHLPGLAISSELEVPRYALTEADAMLAAKRHVVVIPTAWLAVQERMANGDPAQVARTKRLQRQNLELLIRAGVPLAIGSDLFVRAPTEAAYLLGLGVFDNLSLLKMWSQTTAGVIFPRRHIGDLREGYEASFLLLSCNPISDFACTSKITLRMKQGQVLTGY
jgi:imidazolonepropionase-like amidohydrolase